MNDVLKGACLACFALLLIAAYVEQFPARQLRCTFDRNEIGPKGNFGQWYWEFYKCDDGTERRQMVAGPRG